MVQVLPQKTSIGAEVGGALGQGLAQGGDIAFQRGILQQGLTKATEAFKDPNASNIDKSIAFINALAGIPGSEKYAAPVLQMLLGQAQTGNIFGQGNQPGAAVGQGMAGGAPGQNNPSGGPQDLSVGQTPPGPQQAGGFLPPLMTPEQKDAFARNYATQLGNPAAYQEGLKTAVERDNLALAQREIIRARANEIGVSAQELPEFMQLAQRYGHLKNPEEILTSAKRDFEKYRNLKTTLDKALYPGFTKEAARKGIAGAGLIGSMLAGGPTREDALKRLDPVVKDLVDLGFEPQVRQKLAQESLSPTEVEERIHPLTKQAESSLKTFPEAKGLSVERREKDLSDFFSKNVTPDTSLLVLRHKLWNDKGYDWQEIGPSIRRAEMEKGLRLTPAQRTEMSELETQPPRQSLIDVFSDWGRWIDYIRGNK